MAETTQAMKPSPVAVPRQPQDNDPLTTEVPLVVRG
jgi:hypothetical protein